MSQEQWAKVDRSDYESILSLREENWSAAWYESSRTFYAVRHEGAKMIYMHRLITNAPEDMDVNHGNHDGLDNTRGNLEVCSHQDNMRYNRKMRNRSGKPTSSQYKGVHFSKKASPKNPWYATIGGKHLGQFATEVEAAEAYNRAATAHYGEFALLNEISPRD